MQYREIQTDENGSEFIKYPESTCNELRKYIRNVIFRLASRASTYPHTKLLYVEGSNESHNVNVYFDNIDIEELLCSIELDDCELNVMLRFDKLTSKLQICYRLMITNLTNDTYDNFFAYDEETLKELINMFLRSEKTVEWTKED